MLATGLGSLAIGLTWGWLAHHLQGPARRRRRNLAILVTATVAAALVYAWQLGGRAAIVFAAAAVVGAMAHGAWRETIASRVANEDNRPERS